MDVEEVEETLINPDQRIIKQIQISDITATEQIFRDLMGEKVIPRKEYIKTHSEETWYNGE